MYGYLQIFQMCLGLLKRKKTSGLDRAAKVTHAKVIRPQLRSFMPGQCCLFVLVTVRYVPFFGCMVYLRCSTGHGGRPEIHYNPNRKSWFFEIGWSLNCKNFPENFGQLPCMYKRFS